VGFAMTLLIYFAIGGILTVPLALILRISLLIFGPGVAPGVELCAVQESNLDHELCALRPAHGGNSCF